MPHWWVDTSRLKRILLIASVITAVIAAVTAIANTLKAGESYWIATRGFVSEKLESTKAQIAMDFSKTTSRQIDIQIRQEEAERDRIEDKIAEAELQLKRSPGISDEIRNTMGDQIRRWQRSLNAIDEQVRKLQKEK